MGRITEKVHDEWVVNIEEDLRKWFYVDECFDDRQVQEDTLLYRRISRIRLIKFLDQHGIEPTAYRIYSDFADLGNCPIVPGTHHALHQPDFSFDFGDMLLRKGSWGSAGEEALSQAENIEIKKLNAEKLDAEQREARISQVKASTVRELARFNKMCDAATIAKEAAEANPDEKQSEQGGLSASLFQKAVHGAPDYKDGTMRSQQRRKDTRLLCKVYLHKQDQDRLFAPGNYDTIEALSQTLKKKSVTLDGGAKPLIYVGGPFTEALKIMKELGPGAVGPVIAMAGTTYGKSNLFANQFNILVDPQSAREVFALAKAGEIDLTLLPTECVKDTEYDFKFEVFNEQVGKHKESYHHIKNLYWQWGYNRNVTLFDLLAAMTVTTDLYKGMLHSVDFKVDDDGKFHFYQLPADSASKGPSGPGLKMFWTIDGFAEITKKKQATLFEELRWTVEGRPLTQDNSAKSNKG